MKLTKAWGVYVLKVTEKSFTVFVTKTIGLKYFIHI